MKRDEYTECKPSRSRGGKGDKLKKSWSVKKGLGKGKIWDRFWEKIYDFVMPKEKFLW
ncbi:MAG: hypothetical protein CM15mP34_2340 [Gammaproteobacteria bacterium]|nr:MAG: hypothetical protein CM15mP34_2340 [Gammaproteobacteria bacterium]